jgi:hypothetical protein
VKKMQQIKKLEPLIRTGKAPEHALVKWPTVFRKHHARDIYRAPGLERQVALR